VCTEAVRLLFRDADITLNVWHGWLVHLLVMARSPAGARTFAFHDDELGPSLSDWHDCHHFSEGAMSKSVVVFVGIQVALKRVMLAVTVTGMDDGCDVAVDWWERTRTFDDERMIQPGRYPKWLLTK
jgi:hypothetical protein